VTVDAQRFTRLVQEAAAVDEGHARNAIAATLRTLGERLDAGEARQVAALLPPEIAGRIGPHGPAEAFDVDEFIRRVAEREAVDTRTAERDVRAVFTALGAALPAEEIDDLAAQLPKGFAPLLPRGPDVAPLAADELARRVARRAGTEPDRGSPVSW